MTVFHKAFKAQGNKFPTAETGRTKQCSASPSCPSDTFTDLGGGERDIGQKKGSLSLTGQAKVGNNVNYVVSQKQCAISFHFASQRHAAFKLEIHESILKKVAVG